MKSHLFRSLVGVLILAGNLHYGIGTQFLSLPTHTKELAMGAHPLSSFAGSNPAGLFVDGPKPILSVAYGKGYSDVAQSSFSLRSRNFGGTVGLFIRYAGLNGLELRQLSPSDDPLAEFGTYGAAIDLSYSKQTRKLKYGVTLRHLQMQMHTDHSGGWAVDLGVLSHPWKNGSVGLSILNVGTMTSLNESSPKLPIRLLIGGDTRFQGNGWMNTVMATIESSQHVPGLIYRVGNELEYRFLSLQLGTQISQELATVSAGVRIHSGIYRIGYGIRFGSQGLGNPQLIDISVLLP